MPANIKQDREIQENQLDLLTHLYMPQAPEHVPTSSCLLLLLLHSQIHFL